MAIVTPLFTSTYNGYGGISFAGYPLEYDFATSLLQHFPKPPDRNPCVRLDAAQDKQFMFRTRSGAVIVSDVEHAAVRRQICRTRSTA